MPLVGPTYLDYHVILSVSILIGKKVFDYSDMYFPDSGEVKYFYIIFYVTGHSAKNLKY